MGSVVPFNAGGPPAVMAGRTSPSLAAAQAGVQASFAVIGYKGRNWRLKYRGEEELVKDANGVPMPHLDVVIVRVSPAISKQFYDHAYVEGSDDAPDCFSVDGVSPDPSSPKKQCATCAVCPKNAWGSRVTEAGKKGKACQDSRRIAVVPLADIENEAFGGPMMLRVPPMSLNALASYGQLLERKGAGGFEFVATRLGFDYDVAYPKLTFTPIGWLDNEQAQEVLKVMEDPQIDRMLQEAVSEATHDPAEPAAQAEDPLSQGGPAAAFTAPQSAEPAPAPAVAPAPVAAPQPAPAPAQAASAKKRASPFAAAAAAPAQQPAPAAAPAQPVTVVEQAPVDMQSAIDDLLSTTAA